MSADITMPQLSDTMTEGTLVKWLKKEGEKISSGEKIAEVETDKAVMEMEAFDAGVVAALVVAEGQKAAVGALMAVIATGSENPAEVKKKIGSRLPPPHLQPSQLQSLHRGRPPGKRSPPRESPRCAVAMHSSGYAQASNGEIREPDNVGHGATRQAATSVPPVHHQGNGGSRIAISPLARRIATEKNIDLHPLRGSGPGGRIVRQDVLSQTPATTGVANIPRATWQR